MSGETQFRKPWFPWRSGDLWTKHFTKKINGSDIETNPAIRLGNILQRRCNSSQEKNKTQQPPAKITTNPKVEVKQNWKPTKNRFPKLAVILEVWTVRTSQLSWVEALQPWFRVKRHSRRVSVKRQVNIVKLCEILQHVFPSNDAFICIYGIHIYIYA